MGAGNQYESSFKETFKSALDESFAKSALFADDSPNKLSLLVKILKFQTPAMGIRFDTYMTVNYTFINRKTGQTQYEIEIDSFGNVPGNYSFAGYLRRVEARNRAVQDNINRLIKNLKYSKFIQ